MKTIRCSFAATCGGTCADARAAAAEAGNRALLRLDAGATVVSISRRPRRAPVVRLADQRSPAPSLSLSHTDGAVAAAASLPGWRVGVDIERVGRVAAHEARYFLTERELPQLRTTDATTLWCLKEAAWKALECGADVPFSALELKFDTAGRLVGVQLDGTRWSARARVRRLRNHWVAALVRVRDRDADAACSCRPEDAA
jgi:4'-phosphopantetheinyl transferase EntD